MKTVTLFPTHWRGNGDFLILWNPRGTVGDGPGDPGRKPPTQKSSSLGSAQSVWDTSLPGIILPHGDPMSQFFKKQSQTPLGAVCPFQHGLHDSFWPPNSHPFSLPPRKLGYFDLTGNGWATCPTHGLSALFLNKLFLMPQYLNDGLSRKSARPAAPTWQYGTIAIKIQDVRRKKTLETIPRNQGWVSPQQTAPLPMTPHRHLNYFTHREVLVSKWLNGNFLLLLLLWSNRDYWIFGNLRREFSPHICTERFLISGWFWIDNKKAQDSR